MTPEPEHGCENRDCGGIFVCAACDKLKGWCNSASDSTPDLCDDCANKCAYCGVALDGIEPPDIHRDGISIGPELPLCNACGRADGPSCEEIWYRIAKEGQFAEAREAGVPLAQLLRDVSRAELYDEAAMQRSISNKQVKNG